MIRRSLLPALGLLAAGALAACTGATTPTPQTTTPSPATSVATSAPETTTPASEAPATTEPTTAPESEAPSAGATFEIPSFEIPSFEIPSFEIPSFEIPSFEIPSFEPDAALEAAFPDTIDGQPVEGVQSASFLAILQAFDPESETIGQFTSAMQGIGVDPAAVGIAGGTVTLDGDPVQIQALRTPGGEAADALDVLSRIDAPEQAPTLTPQVIGGKNAVVATSADGDVEYFYASGDIAFFLADATLEQAETIFAALP